ncbi:response regulator transcription factor [uncultured Senegalimassilia sp.]|uniref:response regulator transcription factor n=1 Tax=uncultured Senegalimassilia sp. TaxID=1714350 RepID=UPI00338DF905
MINVILADDHEVVRTGIKLLLEADPDIAVVAEAAEGTQAYSLVAQHKPQVLLLDISMPPGQSGLVACEKVARDFPDTKVIILTMFAEPEYLLYTLRGGAAGYVLKNSTPEQLRQAVHDIAAGGSYIHPTMASLLAKHAGNTEANDPSFQQLSSRELEILQLIARGHTNKEIGERMFLSVKTVEAHRSKIFKKLHLKTRADAVDYALRHKLLDL